MRRNTPFPLLPLLVAVLFAVVARVPAAQAQDVPDALADDQCVLCHTDLDYLPEGMLLTSSHMRPELSCQGAPPNLTRPHPRADQYLPPGHSLSSLMRRHRSHRSTPPRLSQWSSPGR